MVKINFSPAWERGTPIACRHGACAVMPGETTVIPIIEGFTENGANVFSSSASGNVALNVNSQNFDSAASTLGLEVSHAFNTNTIAAVVIPSLIAEWVHEYENSSRTVNSSFIDGNQALGPITTAGPIRDWANLGVGLQMQFPQNFVGFLNYEALFIQDGSNQIVSGGLRMSF